MFGNRRNQGKIIYMTIILVTSSKETIKFFLLQTDLISQDLGSSRAEKETAAIFLEKKF